MKKVFTLTIRIIVVGNLKNTNWSKVIGDLIKRSNWKIELIEIKTTINKNKYFAGEETSKILDKVQEGSLVFVVSPNSPIYEVIVTARNLENWVLQGKENVTFIIPDEKGASPSVLQKANIIFAIGEESKSNLMNTVFILNHLSKVQKFLLSKNGE